MVSPIEQTKKSCYLCRDELAPKTSAAFCGDLIADHYEEAPPAAAQQDQGPQNKVPVTHAELIDNTIFNWNLLYSDEHVLGQLRASINMIGLPVNPRSEADFDYARTQIARLRTFTEIIGAELHGFAVADPRVTVSEPGKWFQGKVAQRTKADWERLREIVKGMTSLVYVFDHYLIEPFRNDPKLLYVPNFVTLMEKIRFAHIQQDQEFKAWFPLACNEQYIRGNLITKGIIDNQDQLTKTEDGKREALMAYITELRRQIYEEMLWAYNCLDPVERVKVQLPAQSKRVND